MTSFCRIQNEKAWTAPKALSDFLSSGEILYIGFGSLTEACHPSFVEKLLDVLIERGGKVLLSAPLAALAKRDLPPWIYPLDYAPHDWLFPKVSAVVHHGGVGTLAAGLYAGKPTLVLPFFIDQPYWGRFIEEKKLGPKPLSPFSFTQDAFKKRLDQLLENPEYRKNGEAMKHALSLEPDGVELTIEAIFHSLQKEV